jgi:hypothetical protein
MIWVHYLVGENSILKNEFYKVDLHRVPGAPVGGSMARVRQCPYKTSFLYYFLEFAPLF